jgi:hypothetical protein
MRRTLARRSLSQAQSRRDGVNSSPGPEPSLLAGFFGSDKVDTSGKHLVHPLYAALKLSPFSSFRALTGSLHLLDSALVSDDLSGET